MLRLVVHLDPFVALRRGPAGKAPDLHAVAHAARLGGAGAVRLTLGDEAEARDLRERLDVPLHLDLPLHAAPPRGGDLKVGLEAGLAAALRLKPERVGVKLGAATVLPEGLSDVLERLAQAGIPSALRLPPTEQGLLAANEAGAVWVDLDTAALGAAGTEGLRLKEFLALQRCATTARQLGLRVSVGGGLDVGTLARVAAVSEVEEAHVGFALLARSVFTGLTQAVRDLRLDLRPDLPEEDLPGDGEAGD